MIIGDVVESFRSLVYNDASPFDITVAICFANNADTIAETIRSIAAQKNAPRFELLLVSNATRDASVEVAKVASRGMPMRLLVCESAGYDSNARNVCMREAAAGKLLFLDADDTVDVHYVARMSAALDRSTLVTGMWDLRRLNAADFPVLLQTDRDTVVRMPFNHAGWTFAAAGTLGMRREVPQAIGGFRHELSYAANNEWCFRAFAAGHPVRAVPDAIVNYRLRPSLRAVLRQRYRWGVQEVAAIRAAASYGLPQDRLAGCSVGTYVQILKALARARSGFDLFQAVGWLGLSVGQLVETLRHRRSPAPTPIVPILPGKTARP